MYYACTKKLTAFYNKDSPLYVAQWWLSLLLYRSAALSEGTQCCYNYTDADTETNESGTYNSSLKVLHAPLQCIQTSLSQSIFVQVPGDNVGFFKIVKKKNQLIYEVGLTSFASRSNLGRLKCVNFSNKKSWVLINGVVFDLFCSKKQFYFIQKFSFKKDVCSTDTLNLPS